MPRYETEAIVVGVRNFGDADKMVSLLTKNRGRIKAAAFGCRRPKSPLAAGMQMFNELTLVLTEGRRVDTVRSCSLRRHPKRLAEDLTAMAYGTFVAEIVCEFLPEKQPEPEIFALLEQILPAFEQRNPRIVALAAAFQILARTGVGLSYARCVKCGRKLEGDVFFSASEGGALCAEHRLPESAGYPAHLRTFIETLLGIDWKQPASFMASRQDLLAAEHQLLSYIQELLGKPLRSLSFIRQLA